MPVGDLLIFLAALLLSAAGTGLVRAYARRAELLDIPNHRSSHQVPTPRGGGLALVIVFLCVIAWLFAAGALPQDVFLSLFVGGALVAGIGFADDHSHISARWRFLVQLIAATIAVGLLGGLPGIQFGSTTVDFGRFGDVVAIIFIVWLINLYNFMDGIDGIAGAEAISISGGAIAIIWSLYPDGGFLLSILIAFGGAASGFLIWNWPPAKIFMGDVSSGFLGFTLGTLAVISARQESLPIWCWLILTGVFIVDATTTLITRIINGEKWYSAHSSHAYQKAARRFQGHLPVTVTVLLINVLWLLPWAFLAALKPDFGWWLTIVALSPLILFALFIRAGRPDSETILPAQMGSRE